MAVDKDEKKIAGNYVVKSIYVPHDRLALWGRLQLKVKALGKRSVSEVILLAIEAYLGEAPAD